MDDEDRSPSRRRTAHNHRSTATGQQRTIELNRVLFGDVWLCSGQSNMNWPVRLSNNAAEEVKNANHPEIRSFTVGFYPSLVPMKLPPPARWEVCTPEFAKNFSGVGYFFAREIHQTQKIPIGIIHSSAGATYGEVWISERRACRSTCRRISRSGCAELNKAGRRGRAETSITSAKLEKWTATVDPASAVRKYASDPDLKTEDWLDIVVPRPWQDVGLPDFNGLVWFRHWIDIPAILAPARICHWCCRSSTTPTSPGSTAR